MTVMTKRKLPARLLLFGDCELEGVGVIAPVQCLGTWCGDQVIYHSKKKAPGNLLTNGPVCRRSQIAHLGFFNYYGSGSRRSRRPLIEGWK